mgnify:CR=1 FL=1|tara:strand:+ start:104 stop:535 length:432 start_codon:yes stop_codon:yes gene_type:complete
MATSKIASITKTENTWAGQSGTMYDYQVTMEADEAGSPVSGTASSTSPEAPPYVVGDEVEYTKTENKFGVKLRIKKASTFSDGGGWKPDAGRDEKITNSWALNAAIALIGECKADMSYSEYIDGASLVARLLIHKRDNLNESL